jgi:Kef-type K+ transport system membrane component KefB
VSTESIAVHVVFAIGLITAFSHLTGILARRLSQPAVIGQLFAGIVLGPSLLGRLPGNPTADLFPREVLPFLTVVAQVALVLFLFSVGYELDFRLLRRRLRAVPIVAGCTFAVPMLLGVASALTLTSWYSAPDVPRSAFVLFIAVAVSITAVPVLAGIIRERGLTRTVAGVVTMTSAGAVDGLGWLILAVALLQASVAGQRPWPVTLALLVGYLLAMLLVVRPALQEWFRRSTTSMRSKVPVVTAVAMASAWVTGAVGLHVILGAFLAGLVMPRGEDGEPHPELLQPVRETGGVLLPVFFAVSGLSTDIGALHGRDIGLFLVVCAIAVVGKLGAGLLAARAAGMPWHDSTVVGVLMNTRGLTELIALNVGLQAGIIDERLYTVFVLMALLTTAAAGPLLRGLGYDRVAESPAALPDPVATPAAPPEEVAVSGR